MERVEYDEFGLFHENAEEFGLPYDGPPTVRRESVDLPDGRKISALVWGTDDPEYVFLHGGAQNAHTWDTVAMAIDRPLVAIDLPGHGHSDGPNEATGGQIAPESLAGDVAVAIRKLAPNARGVIGMSLGGLTTIALTAIAPELVRSVVLVDVTPGVDGEKSKVIADFINGPRELPQLRRAAGAHDPVQPHAHRVVAPSRDPPQRAPARRRFVGVAVRAVPHPASASPRRGPRATLRPIRPRTSRGSACSGTPWPRSRCR